MFRKIKEMQQLLKKRMLDNTIADSKIIELSKKKQALAGLAFAEYEKIKHDPASAMDAVELLMVAVELGSDEAFSEMNDRSVNKEELPGIVVDPSDSNDDLFKKGMCHLVGIGAYAQSNAAARQLINQSALGKHTRAAYIVGWLHYLNKLNESERELARAWLEISAASSYTPAQNLLGELYCEDEDFVMASVCFREAANQFDVSAQISLARILAKCEYDETPRTFLLAAHQGDAFAQFHLGDRYFDLNDKTEAIIWFTKSAEQGYSEAEYILGKIYENGEGVTRDIYTAVTWYEKAASQGHINAQYHAGMALLSLADDDSGEPQLIDFEKRMVHWLKAAAENNHRKAQYRLSHLYSNSFGVDKDMDASIYWCQRAAVQGYGKAQHELFFRFIAGDRANPWLAAKWRHLALRKGIKDDRFHSIFYLDNPDYAIARQYYDALLANDAHKFFSILKENDNALWHLLTELDQPFNEMTKKIDYFISYAENNSVSDGCHHLINQINVQFAISFYKFTTENKENTIRGLISMLKKINYANVPGHQIEKLLEIIVDARLKMFDMTFSGDKEIANDLIDAIIKLVARVRSLSTVHLKPGLIKLCTQAIIQSCMGQGYEVNYRDSSLEKDFYMLVSLLTYKSDRKFTVEEVDKIFGKERKFIVKLSSASSSPTVPVGKMGLYGKRNREEDSVDSEDEKQNGQPEAKYQRMNDASGGGKCLRKIKEMKQDLYRRMPELALDNSMVDVNQIKFCEEKQALATLAFAEYNKIKNDPASAMDAVELLMIALEENCQKAYAEIDIRSVNKEALPGLVVNFSDSADELFKKGMCHLLGIGAYAQSNDAAYKLIQESNHTAARYIAAWLHYENKLKASDRGICRDFLDLSAASSYAPVQHLLGMLHFENKEIQKAAQYLRMAANQFHAAALVSLGRMFDKGNGMIKNQQTAFKLFLLGAHQGNPRGQYFIGSKCNAFEDQMNIIQAISWLTKSAEQGYSKAQYELSLLYRDGRGIGKDMEKYSSLCYRAAAQQHGGAQHELFNLYFQGDKIDHWLAARWRYHALQNGMTIQIPSLPPDYISVYCIAEQYYDALLANDAKRFLTMLNKHDDLKSHLFAELDQPLFAGDGMIENIRNLTSFVNMNVSFMTLNLINQINAQLVISYNKITTDNGKKARDEETIRNLHLYLKDINYADVSGEQAIKLLDIIVHLRLEMFEMKFSGDMEIADDLFGAIIQLIARVKSLASVQLGTHLMRLCAKVIIQSCMGEGYEVKFSQNYGVNFSQDDHFQEKDFYMLVDLLAFNNNFTAEEVNEIFGKENKEGKIIDVIGKLLPLEEVVAAAKAAREAEEKAASAASFSATVSVGKMGVYGKRKREESVDSEDDDQPEYKRSRPD